jgi:hypothetical protein
MFHVKHSAWNPSIFYHTIIARSPAQLKSASAP